MKRLIDADALIEYIKECAEAAHDNREWDMEQGYLNAIECVEEQPTIDAEPVRRGKWIWKGEDGDSRWMCSECKCKEYVSTCNGVPDIWQYCPNCGADMRGKTDE